MNQSYWHSGFHIAHEMLLLQQQGMINPTETQLLALIDTICQKGESGKCFASNDYLAKTLGLAERSIERLVSQLRKRGFVTSTIMSERRFLEVTVPLEGCNKRDGRPSGRTGVARQVGRANLILNNRDEGGSPVSGFNLSTSNITKTTPTPEDLARADLLRNHIVTVQHWKHPWRRLDWAGEFRKLRQDVDGDEPRIEKALNHYIANWKRGFRPTIHNAAEFRQRFNWLETIAGRADEDISSVTKICEDVERIVENLLCDRWPKGADKNLAPAVQRSFDNYLRFYQHLEDDPFPKTALGYIETLLAENLPDSYIQRWFERVWRSVHKWTDWNGDLRSYVWSIDHKWFQKQAYERALEYGDAEDWQIVYKLVKEKL